MDFMRDLSTQDKIDVIYDKAYDIALALSATDQENWDYNLIPDTRCEINTYQNQRKTYWSVELINGTMCYEFIWNNNLDSVNCKISCNMDDLAEYSLQLMVSAIESGTFNIEIL